MRDCSSHPVLNIVIGTVIIGSIQLFLVIMSVTYGAADGRFIWISMGKVIVFM